jgi:hypothetical protein
VNGCTRRLFKWSIFLAIASEDRFHSGSNFY